MNDILTKLSNEIRNKKLNDGYNKTDISYIKIYNSKSNEIKLPDSKNPYLFLLLDGTIRIHTQVGILDYVKGQYFLSSVDSPTSCHVISASENNDVLALLMEFSASDVISLILNLDKSLISKILRKKLSCKTVIKSDHEVISTIYKMFSCVTDKERLSFMKNHLKKEVIFNILCGTYGLEFIKSIINTQEPLAIYEINSWIKQNFKKNFTAQDLASKKNMSVSNFHKKFKNAIGMGPLQCQKRLRLTEARRLMLDENMSVTDSALEVGYESLSQFIRDYKKMFMTSPKEDVQKLKKQLKIKA